MIGSGFLPQVRIYGLLSRDILKFLLLYVQVGSQLCIILNHHRFWYFHLQSIFKQKQKKGRKKKPAAKKNQTYTIIITELKRGPVFAYLVCWSWKRFCKLLRDECKKHMELALGRLASVLLRASLQLPSDCWARRRKATVLHGTNPVLLRRRRRVLLLTVGCACLKLADCPSSGRDTQLKFAQRRPP